MKRSSITLGCTIILVLILIACTPTRNSTQQPFTVLAVEPFLADITQNIAGDRLKVNSLIPIGVDPHSFEATPQDVARIASSDLLVENGFSLEDWLKPILVNTGGKQIIIEASNGLTGRIPRAGEPVGEKDPHFWLDPTKVITYVENIRAGLTQIDPGGAAIYRQRAEAYANALKELDQWIQTQVSQVPPNRRLLVTNHESLGYFADRYGFQVIGTIIPSVSTGSSPSAQQMAQLIDQVKKSGARVVFLEMGSNPQLAEQLSNETGIKVVTDLYTHTLTLPGGPAPNYMDMMRYDTKIIVEALK
jgi:ABC-type Zn uptake system ZnuABC Zn-binding protein ZnuA